MKIFIFSFLISIGLNGFAQNKFHKCKLFFNNGNQVEGFAKFPTNISMDDKIKYKKTLRTDDVTKIDGSRLKEIIYTTKEGRTYFFLNTKFYKSRLDDKSNVKTKLYRPYWMVHSYMHDKLSVFILSEGYKINKGGGLTSYSINQLGLGDYALIYLVKKPKEEYPSMLSFRANGYVNNGNKFFKRVAMAYFKEDKSILKRIRKNEFGLETYDALIRAYCNCDYKDKFYIHY